jgi:hypothetical protein
MVRSDDRGESNVIVQKDLIHPDNTEHDQLSESVDLQPGPIDEEDLLDWNVWLDSPPPRPERTIVVRLEYAGRDAPRAVNTSWEE